MCRTVHNQGTSSSLEGVPISGYTSPGYYQWSHSMPLPHHADPQPSEKQHSMEVKRGRFQLQPAKTFWATKASDLASRGSSGLICEILALSPWVL